VNAVQAGAQATLDALPAMVDHLVADLAVANGVIATLRENLAQENIDRETRNLALTSQGNLLSAALGSLGSRLTAVEGNSVLTLDGKLSLALALALAGTTARFSGVNVQVTSGAGKTDSAIHGRGNLIVGYDGTRITSTSNKNGSHNLVIGPEHNYSSYGGLVTGLRNTVSEQHASVSGGVETPPAAVSVA
jgi:hypothetical protein